MLSGAKPAGSTMGRMPSSAWAWLTAASTAPMQAGESSVPRRGRSACSRATGATLWPGSGIPVSDSDDGDRPQRLERPGATWLPGRPSRCRCTCAACGEVASVAASEDPPRSCARRVAGRVEGGSHDEMARPEAAEDDSAVGPAARGPVSRASGHPAVGTVVVQPLEVRVEPVVDVADPFGRHGAVGRAGPGRQARRVGALLGTGIEGRASRPANGARPAVDPFAVDGDEELLGDRQSREVGGERHGAHALLGPGGVDGVEGDAQARPRGVGADGRAGLGVVGHGRHRLRGSRPVRLPRVPAGRAAGQQEGQRRRTPPSERAVRLAGRRAGMLGTPHQVSKRSHAGGPSGTSARRCIGTAVRTSAPTG